MGSAAVAVAPRKSPSSGRRTNKPLVEKKRRARINGCLGQLKSLILSAMQAEQGAQVSRLEKADILEMTVKYLRHVQKQQVHTAALGSEPEVAAKFSAGYTECATEVIRYIDQAQCVTSDIRSRLESHLVERLRDAVCPPPATSASACNVGVPVSANAAVATQQQQQQQPQIEMKKEVENVTCSSRSNLNAKEDQNVPKLTANLEQIKVMASTLASSTGACEPANPLVSSGVIPGPTLASSASTTDEYARHYQTAVDLANMAAGVILPDQTPSSHSATSTKPHGNPDLTRCKSISPAQENKERGRPRKRYNSTESAVPQPQPLSNNNSTANLNKNNTIGSVNSAFTHKNVIDSSGRLLSGADNSQEQFSNSVNEKNSYFNKESYLRSLQRPLHIDIPECADSVLDTYTIQKLHCRSNNGTIRDIPSSATSPNSSTAMQIPPSSPSSASSPSLSSSSGTTTIYHYVEEPPPTLLYAYNYNLCQRANNNNNNNKQAFNSPRVNYSLVVCQPAEGELATAPTTVSTLPAHGETFHATFNLEQSRRGNAGSTTFYCAPQPAATLAQGQGERTVQHPAAMNAPPTLTSTPQAQEFGGRGGRRLDANNNISFYGSHQLQCRPTFHGSCEPDHSSLRKDPAAAGCVPIPAVGFYSHHRCIPNQDNGVVTLTHAAPAELSSNQAGAQFHGDSRTCTSAHLGAPRPPRWCNQSPAGQQTTSSSSNKRGSSPHCVNQHNNRLAHQPPPHAAPSSSSYHAQVNGQPSRSDSTPLSLPVPPSPLCQPHSLPHCHSNGPADGGIHRPSTFAFSLPSPPPPSPPQDSSRPALKKHLLFGQRSELTRRQGPADDATTQLTGAPGTFEQQTTLCRTRSSPSSRRYPSAPDDYSYHHELMQEQTTVMTRVVQHGQTAPGNGAQCVSMSSAKKPCLQSGGMTSCHRGGHVTEEPMVWRPW